MAEQRPKHPARSASPRSRPWLNGVYAGFWLYMFLCAINVMGSGLKTLGKSSDWLERLLAHGENPFVALMGSVLVTAVVQSSSFTTALIITLVAAGQMQMETAVYAVMGANIGTSVTNIIVALGNVRIRRQFRRAFTAALVHDIFNWLTVALLFPIEWISSAMHSSGYGVLTRASHWIASLLGLEAIEKPNSPIKMITKPIVNGADALMQRVVPGDDPRALGVAVAIVGLLLLFTSLLFMVSNLKGAILRRIESLFGRVFFRNDFSAYVVGAVTTVLVQSSSITTSLIVPLAGAGVVKLKRVYPYTLGANLGTTVTGVIAASANPVAAAVTVAVSHVTFNLIGTLIWYPLRRVPIGIARWYGRLASRSKRYAFLFLFLVFIVVPLTGLLTTELIQRMSAQPYEGDAVFKELLAALKSGDMLDAAFSQFDEMLDHAQWMFVRADEVLQRKVPPAEVKDAIYRRDQAVNELLRSIRRKIVRHLTVNPGGDVAACLALMSVAKDAERIGDYCKNVFEVGSLYQEDYSVPRYHEPLDLIEAQVEELFGLVRTAFSSSDHQGAKASIKQAGTIRAECDDLIDQLLQDTQSMQTHEAVAYSLLARHYKRVAGHLSNIATAVSGKIEDLDFRPH